MSNSTSRFAKYKSSDLPPLWKPEPGDSRIGRLVSADREYESTDGETGEKTMIPILDLVEVDSGEPWSFMSGAWRWLEELAEKDPADGDVVRISRNRRYRQEPGLHPRDHRERNGEGRRTEGGR